jgi:hypothetical protein
MASAVGRAADPDNVTVGLKPAERFTHRLGLDPHVLGKLCLRHRALCVENLDGYNTRMGKANGPKFFIP